ncbi:MAG TPA: DUF2177 family protein [Phenylobacterium sp.]|nr:DUF2177 family protein [Phenylobacterium sp.]
MLKYIITYLGTGLAFAAIDFVWLAWLSARVYRPTLDPVLADKVNLTAAVIFYLVYVLGVVGLAVVPAGREGSWKKAALTGAALGAFAYATYDLTNQATLKVWATSITVADITWGTFLTGTAAAVGFFIWRWAAKTFG